MRDAHDNRDGAPPASETGSHLASFPGYQGMELAAIHQYLLGRCSDAEGRRIEAWAAESSERRRYLEALRELHHRAPDAGRAERATAWGKIAARLERPTTSERQAFRAAWEAPPVRVDLQHRRRPRVLAGAFAPRRGAWTMPLAVAALLAVAAAGLRMVNDSLAQGAVAAPETMRRVTTTRGQRAEINLDDGTRVVLGVDSRLEFPSDFGATRRDVYLAGTAYFHVVHDPQRPFAVHTANAVTRDVGTQFVVRAYPGDRRTEVVVTEGSVAIGPRQDDGARPAVLTHDERGVLTTGNAAVAVSAVDPAAYTAWMQGKLVFRDAPLAAVLRELRRWYATDVELGDASLASLPFSAAFTAESFREAMATVTTVLPVRAVREGMKVVLYRKRGSRLGGRPVGR